MADRLAVSTNTYHSYTFEEALTGIAAAGFTSVELSSVPGWTEHVLRASTEQDLHDVAKLVSSFGLEAISLSGHSDLASDEGIEEFRKALGIAARLGIRWVTTSTGGHDASSEGTIEEQRVFFLSRIRPLAQEAAADGIAICLETHGGVSATGALAAQLVQEIGMPNVGINYDTANVIFYGHVRPEEDIVAAAPYVDHLHIKDQIGGPGVWNFPQIGTGEVDFAPIFAALDKVGFAGPCSIEIEFQGEPWPPLDVVESTLRNSREYLRQYIPVQDLA